MFEPAVGEATASMASNNVLDAVKNFSLSGSAAVFAEFVTIPLDTAKVILPSISALRYAVCLNLKAQRTQIHLVCTLHSLRAHVGAVAAAEPIWQCPSAQRQCKCDSRDRAEGRGTRTLQGNDV